MSKTIIKKKPTFSTILHTKRLQKDVFPENSTAHCIVLSLGIVMAIVHCTIFYDCIIPNLWMIVGIQNASSFKDAMNQFGFIWNG